MSPTRRSIKKEKQVKRAAKEYGGALVRGQNEPEVNASAGENASGNAVPVANVPTGNTVESNVKFEAKAIAVGTQQKIAQEKITDVEDAVEDAQKAEELESSLPDTAADASQHANDVAPDTTARIRKIVIEESAEHGCAVTDSTSDENTPNNGEANSNETLPKNNANQRKQVKNAAQQREDRKNKRKSVKAKAKKIVPKVIAGVIIAVVVLVIVFFVAAGVNRWMRYDDAASIQGKWQIYGSDSSIQINSTDIILADDVSYEYELDETAKTISYEFGSLSGGGHYRFSYDRDTLAIIEDGTHVWTYTAIDDLCWWFEHLPDLVQGNVVLPAEPGKTVTLLVRVQDGVTTDGASSDATDGATAEKGNESGSASGESADAGQNAKTDSGESNGAANSDMVDAAGSSASEQTQ